MPLFRNIRDPLVDASIGIGATINFDIPVQMDTKRGATVQWGARVFVQVNTAGPAEIRISYSIDGPSENGGTFRDRGTVDRVCANMDYRINLHALGTNIRIAVTNIDTVTNTVELFSVIL